MGAIERIDEATVVGNPGPACRLNRPRHLEGKLAGSEVAFCSRGTAFADQAPQVPVSTDVVKAVIVDAHVADVRCHHLPDPAPSQIEELLFTGRFILIERRAKLKSLGPLRPASRRVLAVPGKHRRAKLGIPTTIELADLTRGGLEKSLQGLLQPGQSYRRFNVHAVSSPLLKSPSKITAETQRTRRKKNRYFLSILCALASSIRP